MRRSQGVHEQLIEAWIPITLTAAFLQNARSSLQKHLKGSLSTSAAAYVRFLYAFPFVLLYLAILRYGAELEFPEVNGRFLFFAGLGSTAQIVATALLIHLFSFRNFVVATAYSKTETIQAAAAGMLILSDPITSWALLAIVVSLVGVMLLAIAKRELGVREFFSSLFRKTAGIGLASGAGFGLAAVSYRAASLSLDGSFVASAAYTLAVSLLLQTVTMGLYLRLAEPGQLTLVFRSWRISGAVGLAGMSASACWFTAMTIRNAAHVKALGQVELIFAFVVTAVFFRERITSREVLGVLLVVTGILVLLLRG